MAQSTSIENFCHYFVKKLIGEKNVVFRTVCNASHRYLTSFKIPLMRAQLLSSILFILEVIPLKRCVIFKQPKNKLGLKKPKQHLFIASHLRIYATIFFLSTSIKTLPKNVAQGYDYSKRLEAIFSDILTSRLLKCRKMNGVASRLVNESPAQGYPGLTAKHH